MSETGDGTEARKRRAIFRATHRGTKEMDWILGRFAESRVAAMDSDELSLFEEFLALPDPDIDRWIMGGPEPTLDEPMAELVQRLRQFHRIDG